MELYSYIPPPGKKIQISVKPFPVDDSVPTEDEIEWAVTQLLNHRSGGLSGMREEHLKRWLATAQNAEKAEKEATMTARAGMKENSGTTSVQSETEPTDADNWAMVVDLVQSVLQEGKLAEKATWQAVVLIPTGKMVYWGIGLVEATWKVVAAILNLQLTDSITF